MPLRQPREQIVDPFHGPRTRAADHRQVLDHRERREDAALLWHPRDTGVGPTLRRPPRDIVRIEADRSGAQPGESQQRRDQRRLAGTVAPEQRETIAGEHERDILEHDRVTIPGGQVLRLQHRAIHAARPRYTCFTRVSVAIS
jgi:hypothetical protein